MSVIGKIKIWASIGIAILSYPLVNLLPLSDFFKGIAIIVTFIAAYIVLGMLIKKLRQ